MEIYIKNIQNCVFHLLKCDLLCLVILKTYNKCQNNTYLLVTVLNFLTLKAKKFIKNIFQKFLKKNLKSNCGGLKEVWWSSG